MTMALDTDGMSVTRELLTDGVATGREIVRRNPLVLVGAFFAALLFALVIGRRRRQ